MSLSARPGNDWQLSRGPSQRHAHLDTTENNNRAALGKALHRSSLAGRLPAVPVGRALDSCQHTQIGDMPALVRIRDTGPGRPDLITGGCRTTTRSACFKRLEKPSLPRRHRHADTASEVSTYYSRLVLNSSMCMLTASDRTTTPQRDMPRTSGTSYACEQLVEQLQPSQHPSSMPYTWVTSGTDDAILYAIAVEIANTFASVCRWVIKRRAWSFADKGSAVSDEAAMSTFNLRYWAPAEAMLQILLRARASCLGCVEVDVAGHGSGFVKRRAEQHAVGPSGRTAPAAIWPPNGDAVLLRRPRRVRPDCTQTQPHRVSSRAALATRSQTAAHGDIETGLRMVNMVRSVTAKRYHSLPIMYKSIHLRP
ncbi:hypothetical protein OPT61_g8395 [Boeremia exigua]|uniref:Uncharacterized protein n=1 Tax=Boeremia exigua TaxID=749465 RepID=A0ACC2HZC7_9PLEO|nr:hypothetical protein OPT61_g8395 [Boeremia exigua]